MSLFPRNDDGKIAYTKMWEFKLLKGIIMFFVYVLLIIYSVMGVQSAKTWIELRIYAGDFDVKNVYEVADKIAARDDQTLLSHLLFKYPLDYNDELVERLEPLTPKFHAAYFFATATRYYQAGNKDEALFWTMLGRFRMRYDALRCQYETADLVANQYSILYSSADILRDLINLDAQKQKEILLFVNHYVKSMKNEINVANSSVCYFHNYGDYISSSYLKLKFLGKRYSWC